MKQKVTEPSDLEAEHSDTEPQEMETDEKDTNILELEKKLALMGERVERTEVNNSHGGHGRKGKTAVLALDSLVVNLAKTDLSRR